MKKNCRLRVGKNTEVNSFNRILDTKHSCQLSCNFQHMIKLSSLTQTHSNKKQTKKRKYTKEKKKSLINYNLFYI